MYFSKSGSGSAPNLPTTDGITYDSLPDLLSGAHEILCTNIYSPSGNNVPVTYTLPLTTNFVNDVTAGGDVTFLLYAADDQIGYLFNSYSYGRSNEPLLQVAAALNTMPLKILSGYFTNGLFHFTGIGGTNFQYQLQANSDLTTTNWQMIGTATADSTGAIQFDDTTTNQPQRFYRLSR
jgi:hypothetical protein